MNYEKGMVTEFEGKIKENELILTEKSCNIKGELKKEVQYKFYEY